MSKPLASKKFGRFVAEIVPNDDREGVNCFVTCGKAGASLEMVADHGYIEPTDSTRIDVPDDLITEMLNWAVSKGY